MFDSWLNICVCVCGHVVLVREECIKFVPNLQFSVFIFQTPLSSPTDGINAQ